MLTHLRPITAIALTLLGLSCAQTPEGIPVGPNHKHLKAHPVFGDAIVLQDSDFILIPFWTQTNENQQIQQSFGSPPVSLEQSLQLAFSGSLSADTKLTSSPIGQFSVAQSVHWNNVAFFQRSTGACRLIFDRPAVITSAYLPSNAPAPRTDAGHPGDAKKAAPLKILLFAVAEHDTNRDGYINGEDAVVLYSCDLSGDNLTRLTPEGTQLTGIIPDGEESICARVLWDSDGDHHFTADDEAMLYRIDLRHPAEGKRMISEDVRKNAEGIVEGK